LGRSEPPEKDVLKIPVEVRTIFPDVKNVLFEVKNVFLDVKNLVLDVLKVLRRSGRLSVPALVRCAALPPAAGEAGFQVLADRLRTRNAVLCRGPRVVVKGKGRVKRLAPRGHDGVLNGSLQPPDQGRQTPKPVGVRKIHVESRHVHATGGRRRVVRGVIAGFSAAFANGVDAPQLFAYTAGAGGYTEACGLSVGRRNAPTLIKNILDIIVNKKYKLKGFYEMIPEIQAYFDGINGIIYLFYNINKLIKNVKIICMEE
jgi:hypothetical protein